MREANRVYRLRNQSGLSTGHPLMDEAILRIVEKSVTPYKEKTYGRKG